MSSIYAYIATPSVFGPAGGRTTLSERTRTRTQSSVDRLRRTIIAIVVVAVVGFAGIFIYNEEAARSCTAKGEETTGSIIKKCEQPPSSLEEFLR